jgi:hypothetical protein
MQIKSPQNDLQCKDQFELEQMTNCFFELSLDSDIISNSESLDYCFVGEGVPPSLQKGFRTNSIHILLSATAVRKFVPFENEMCV